MGALLALASAGCYGVADYVGGLLARRGRSAVVALLGQVGALLITVGAAPIVGATAVGTTDLAWGALSGIGTGLGMAWPYRGMSRGDMSVVVPISAVAGVALSVLVGVLVLGDRPSPLSWAGIAVAVPALWLVSGSTGGTGRLPTGAALDGFLASAAIALQYLALPRSRRRQGSVRWWPAGSPPPP